MEPLIAFLNSIYPISPSLQEHFKLILKHKELKRGQYLLKEGEYCDTISFIQSGLLHLYFTDEGTKVTNWFMFPGDVAIAAESFFNKVKSTESIQAIEDCELLYISRQEAYDIFDNYLEFNINRALLNQKYFLIKNEHAKQLQRGSAWDRYQWFIEFYPGLASRVPAKYIATYLGITEETLSRIRSKNR